MPDALTRPYPARYHVGMKKISVERAPALIRAARTAAGLSQAELARRADLRQSHIAAMESGSRAVSAEMLTRVLRAARYRPSIPLEEHAEEIIRLGASEGIHNIRVFGSTVRGEDRFTSDIDLLVDVDEGRSYFDIATFINEVEDLTGFPVDVVVDREARPGFLEDTELVPL